MLITIRFLDAAGNISFHDPFRLSSTTLFQTARQQGQHYRKKGVNWTLDALSWLGAQFTASDTNRDDRERIVFEIALSAFLLDTLFGGIAPEAFLRSDLLVTIAPDGTTTFQRVDRASVTLAESSPRSLSESA